MDVPSASMHTTVARYSYGGEDDWQRLGGHLMLLTQSSWASTRVRMCLEEMGSKSSTSVCSQATVSTDLRFRKRKGLRLGSGETIVSFDVNCFTQHNKKNKKIEIVLKKGGMRPHPKIFRPE
uniref:Uncharacterized protein n=1 Tax=Anguilla anguilla TaxID=7936 RepID=A0A0E9S906_ANGAN